MIKPLQWHGFQSQQPPDRPSDDCERLAGASNQRAVFADGGGGRINAQVVGDFQADWLMFGENLLPRRKMLGRARQG